MSPNVDDIAALDHQRFREWTSLHGLSPWCGSTGWHNGERPFVAWAERAGYRMDVAVNSDLEHRPDIVEGYALVVSVGHDEYWSWGMRDTLESHIATGLPVPTGTDGTPADFEVLATAPARLWDKDEQPSRYRPGPQGDLEWFAQEVFGEASEEAVQRLAHNAVLGTCSRGGTVFTTGATDWSYGLAGRDPLVEQVTRNVLDRLSRTPAS